MQSGNTVYLGGSLLPGDKAQSLLDMCGWRSGSGPCAGSAGT